VIHFFITLIDRCATALTDPDRRDRAIIGVLAGYVVLWTLYGVMAKAGQGVNSDAAEVVAWSRHLALGYVKHPPLAAWLVRVWFTLIPVHEWTYYLFSMTYTAAGLWLAWRLFGCYLDPEKRVVALVLLTLTPIAGFFALRFDLNIVLPPLWAATALCFLRSFETRSAGWAALAGAAAAAAMLGKYWSVFLLIALAVAALLDRRRADYFRSRAPWITIAVGTLLLTPHIIWLVQNHFSPFDYAISERATKSFAEAVRITGNYLAGGAAYMAVPILLALAVGRPSFAAVADTLHPRSDERRFILIAFGVLMLFPAVVAIAGQMNFNSIWAMVGFVFLPIVLLSSPKLSIDRRAVKIALAIAIAFPVTITIAAPAIAIAIHRLGRIDNAMYAEVLAQRMQLEWRKVTDRPLRIVGGDGDLAYQVAFYISGAPASLMIEEPYLAPWVDTARITRQGIVLVCRYGVNVDNLLGCSLGYGKYAMHKIIDGRPNVRRIEVELKKTFFGAPDQTLPFLIFVVPPAASG
jgi:hypothetical protein